MTPFERWFCVVAFGYQPHHAASLKMADEPYPDGP
jgi:hypothetical protein